MTQPFHVDADIALAESLPPSAFCERGWLEQERSAVFGPSWVCVPWRPFDAEAEDGRTLADMVVRRGSRFPVTVHDEPVLLQRDWRGRLRAFPNVCTHAWHTLVDGPGRDKTIVCPQHGRRFDTDGRVLSHPGVDAHPSFPRPCDHLTQWEADTWHRFAFVRQHAGGPKLSEVLQPVLDSVALLPWDQARRVSSGAETRQVTGNWKLHAWNFLDHFHIGHVHRAPHGLADAIELNDYRTELYDHSALQWVRARREADGFAPDHLPGRFAGPGRVFSLWWFVFPNLALNIYPWGVSVNLFSPGREPDTTVFHWYILVWDEEKYAHRDERWLLSQVDAEDVEALRQVQRGLRSSSVSRGLFAPQYEQSAHWFHHRISALMAASPG